MTIEQYNNLKPFEGEMQQIIRNNAIINTPIEFRETIHRIGKELGYNVCNCTSGTFTLTSRLYNEYLKLKAHEREELETKNTKINKRKPKNKNDD